MLFNEPKLLKLRWTRHKLRNDARFSALQRAEIAEIAAKRDVAVRAAGFSALQRAEIAEIVEKADRSEFGVVFQCSSTSRNC